MLDRAEQAVFRYLEVFMTNKIISNDDWSRVIDQSARFVNLIMLDSNEEAEKVRLSMLRLLQRLEVKYGKHPSILATKSDFLKYKKRRIELLHSALSLLQNENKKEKLFCISSLCSIYIEEECDAEIGAIWLKKFKETLSDFPDEAEQAEYDSLSLVLKSINQPA